MKIKSAFLELSVSADASTVLLVNRVTGTRWKLDPATILADGSGCERVPYGANTKKFGENAVDPKTAPATRFDKASASKLGDRALAVSLKGAPGELSLIYELTQDACRVTAVPGQSTVTSFALPGAFRPENMTVLPVLLAKNQGVWHKGTGAPVCVHMTRTGHGGWSMPFFAAVGDRDALLTIIETEHDSRTWFEKTQDGRTVVAAVQDPSRGAMRYERSVLLKFTKPDVTSICRTYRHYVKDKGNLVTWAEKIAARPNLEKLFGALMCFIGYCQDESLDYAASFRALKAMGFDRAFVYPLAIGNIVEGFLMGGRPPIDIRSQLSMLDELGYLSCSWMWVEDVTDQREDMMLRQDGSSMFSWQIENVKWLRCCPVRQLAIANHIQDERMKGFSAAHFDVTTSRDGLECFHPDHPIDRREDAAWRRKVMETAAARGNVVSSEGYWGFAAPSYDIGSVKIPIPVHDDWFTVPATSLVYHDSCIHTWWEVDNYNNPWHRNQSDRDKTLFPISGGGWQAVQAAQDALAGTPPHVMPFGSQYAFVGGRMPDTELYRYNLDMPEVKEALRLALPVAQLHRKIGKLDCVAHETLADDGSVQATVFEDGTRVVANYASERREIKGAGLMDGLSWKMG